MTDSNRSDHLPHMSYDYLPEVNLTRLPWVTMASGNWSVTGHEPGGLDGPLAEGPPGMPPGMPPTTLALHSVLAALHFYYTPVLAAIGVLGNVLCVVVLVDDVLCHLSTTHYLIGVAVADSLVLLHRFHEWLANYNITFYRLGGWCQFITFVRYVSEFLSLWFVIAYVTDRFVGLCFPHKEAAMCTPTRAKIVIIGMTIVAIVVYLNISIMAGLIAIEEHLMCTTLRMFVDTQARLDKAHVFINSFLPMCSLVAMLGAVVWRLCRRKHADGGGGPASLPMNLRDAHSNYATRRQSRPVNETDIRVNQTKPLLTILISYLFMNLPYEGLKFVHTVNMINYNSVLSMEDFLWQQIFLYVKYTNCSLNLLLLSLSYASFRTRGRKLPARVRKLCKWRAGTEEAESMTSAAAALEAGTETTGVSSGDTPNT